MIWEEEAGKIMSLSSSPGGAYLSWPTIIATSDNQEWKLEKAGLVLTWAVTT